MDVDSYCCLCCPVMDAARKPQAKPRVELLAEEQRKKSGAMEGDIRTSQRSNPLQDPVETTTIPSLSNVSFLYHTYIIWFFRRMKHEMECTMFLRLALVLAVVIFFTILIPSMIQSRRQTYQQQQQQQQQEGTKRKKRKNDELRWMAGRTNPGPSFVLDRNRIVALFHDDMPQVNLTLCEDKCHSQGCQSYITPLDSCFSSGTLFPNDPSWSDGWDIFDTLITTTETKTTPTNPNTIHKNEQETILHRVIYSSKDGTCTTDRNSPPPDSFDIPWNVCVGPFGRPRPWGTFQFAVPSI